MTDLPIPHGLGPKRTAILQVAFRQIGIVEQPLGSNRGKDVEKFMPNWAIPADPHTPGPAWCCFSAFWVANQALGKYPLGRHHGSCTKAFKEAKTFGMFVRNDGIQVPYPGDAFLVGKGEEMHHIGITYRVAPGVGEINTLEGNCGQRFKLGRRSLTDGEIAGWIVFVPDEHPDGFERGLVEAPWTARSPTR